MLLVWLSILTRSCGLLWVLRRASKMSVTDFLLSNISLISSPHGGRNRWPGVHC